MTKPNTTTDVLPGGVGRSTLAVGPSVPRLTRGAGYEVFDTDGVALIDLNNNFTTHVHGNAHPEIVAAATRALEGGASFGAPHESEREHARVLLERLPGAEQVRYTNSGSEAVMTAVRLARAFTGRDAIVAIEGAYHGSSETALCTSPKPQMRRGIPGALLSLVSLVPFDDVGALVAAVRELDEGPAAILIDLAPNRPGLRRLSDEFVRTARELADETGALLIVDEIITFRLAYGGLAETAEVQADLTTLGKVIGGGLPIGAVAGPERFMQVLNPFYEKPIESAGTFTGNPVAMAAGIASLALLDRPAIERINALGARLREGLAGAVDPAWKVQGTGSLAKLAPAGDGDPFTLGHELWWAAYGESVLVTPNGTLAVSTPMDEQVIDKAVEALARATRRVGSGR